MGFNIMLSATGNAPCTCTYYNDAGTMNHMVTVVISCLFLAITALNIISLISCCQRFSKALGTS